MRSLRDGAKIYNLNFRSANISPLSQYGKLYTRAIALTQRYSSNGRIVGTLYNKSLNNSTVQFDSIDPLVAIVQLTAGSGTKYIEAVYNDLQSRANSNYIMR